MKSSASSHNKPYAVLVEWQVPSRHHVKFIKEVGNLVQDNFKLYKGLLSASFHRSADGKKIINYALWESRKAWKDALKIPGRADVTARIQKVIRKYGAKSLGVEGFHITRVIGDKQQAPFTTSPNSAK